MFGKRILILVAHPDDEVVACAASIARARAQGAEIFALYLTHGCLAQDVLWPWQRKNYVKYVAVRRSEAERAAEALGITALGWPVRPARQLWCELPQVLAEVEAAMSQCRPDQIWVPAYEGGNPDHDALNAVGFKLKNRLSVLEFAEYNNFGGQRRHRHSFPPMKPCARRCFRPKKPRPNVRCLKIYRRKKAIYPMSVANAKIPAVGSL